MSSPVVNVEGLYYSKLEIDKRFMWAYHVNREKFPAHFKGVGLFTVIEKFVADERWWIFSPNEEKNKYLILQRDMIKWKDL